MKENLEKIIESLLLSASRPLSESDILKAFSQEEDINIDKVRIALSDLKEFYSDRSFELVKVANGYRLKIKQDYSLWISNFYRECSNPSK